MKAKRWPFLSSEGRYSPYHFWFDGWTKRPDDLWLNCNFWSRRVLIELGGDIAKLP